MKSTTERVNKGHRLAFGALFDLEQAVVNMRTGKGAGSRYRLAPAHGFPHLERSCKTILPYVAFIGQVLFIPLVLDIEWI